METKRELFIRRINNFLACNKIAYDEIIVIGETALELIGVKTSSCRDINIHIDSKLFLKMHRKAIQFKENNIVPSYYGKRKFLRFGHNLNVFSLDEISQTLSAKDLYVTDGIVHLSGLGLEKFDLKKISKIQRDDIVKKQSLPKTMNGVIRKWK